MAAESDHVKSATALAPPEIRGMHQPKRAAISGWIGSTLEYYDFFIFATAASLVFPQIFFPPDDPNVAIIASLGTYGVGYVARPIGAFVLGHWGDTHGRKNVLLVCMFVMGFATMAVGFLPTYSEVGILAPALLVVLRLIQGFAVAGEISGSSSLSVEHAPIGRRGFFASFTVQGVQAGQLTSIAIFLPLSAFLLPQDFLLWGWRIPFLLSALLIMAGWYVRKSVDEAPEFCDQKARATASRAPVIEAIATSWPDMLRVAIMALTSVIPATMVFGAAYAVQPAYGIGLPPTTYLWVPLTGGVTALIVIPFMGSLSDRVGRRPPIIVGAITAGLLSFAYLYALSVSNVALACVAASLMSGVAFQGFNAVYTSYFPELFPTRFRVSAMAISQNVGTTASAFLPALFALVAPAGSSHIPVIVGAITLAVSLAAALAALSARETYRVHLRDLGSRDAEQVSDGEYNRMRAEWRN